MRSNQSLTLVTLVQACAKSSVTCPMSLAQGSLSMDSSALAWLDVDHASFDLPCCLRNMALDDETFAKYKSQLAPAWFEMLFTPGLLCSSQMLLPSLRA